LKKQQQTQNILHRYPWWHLQLTLASKALSWRSCLRPFLQRPTSLTSARGSFRTFSTRSSFWTTLPYLNSSMMKWWWEIWKKKLAKISKMNECVCCRGDGSCRRSGTQLFQRHGKLHWRTTPHCTLTLYVTTVLRMWGEVMEKRNIYHHLSMLEMVKAWKSC